MKKLCKKCGLQISAQNYSRHIARCDGSGLRAFVKAPVPDNYICQYCSKECKNLNSLRQHEVRCSKNPDRRAHDHLVEHIRQRKGTTKETNEVVAKQAAKLKAKYADGTIKRKPFHEIKDINEYIHSEHNKELLDNWITYASTIDVSYLDPTQLRVDNSGYTRIHHLSKSEKYTNNMLISFEHEYIANQLIDNCLESSNTVHHINRIRTDNRPQNLIVFIDRANHLRYHTSKYAYLIFNSETKLFSCEIRK